MGFISTCFSISLDISTSQVPHMVNITYIQTLHTHGSCIA